MVSSALIFLNCTVSALIETKKFIINLLLFFYSADQSTALPPDLTLAAVSNHAGSSASPHQTDGPPNEVAQRTRDPAGRDETSPQTTTVTAFKGMVHSETGTNDLYEADLLTTSSAVDASQDRNVPVITAGPGAPSPSGTQGKHACTVYNAYSYFNLELY